MKQKLAFCWSGGKDSALALHRLLTAGRYEVVALLTTCNDEFQRVSMHGVRVELAEKQARSIGLPLDKVFVSQCGSNAEYSEKMNRQLRAYQEQGVTHIGYGDIFLEDLKKWREANLAQVGLRGVFPLWKEDTTALIGEFIRKQFGSIICCVSDAYLDESALGRRIDAEFVAWLPKDVDPCGENGEFHSFAFAGPIFREPIQVKEGEHVYRPITETHPRSAADSGPPSTTRAAQGFWFCDLVLTTAVPQKP